MNAYLIDPVAKTVTLVEYTGDYKNIYTHIEADCFDAVLIHKNNDTIFVDDEGLLKGPVTFFKLKNYSQLLAGKGLVLGTNNNGESTAPIQTLEQLTELVEFGSMARYSDRIFWVPDNGEPVEV